MAQVVLRVSVQQLVLSHTPPCMRSSDSCSLASHLSETQPVRHRAQNRSAVGATTTDKEQQRLTDSVTTITYTSHHHPNTCPLRQSHYYTIPGAPWGTLPRRNTRSRPRMAATTTSRLQTSPREGTTVGTTVGLRPRPAACRVRFLLAAVMG